MEHTVRMDETRWPKKILEWIPPGKRIQGRSRHSWRDDMMRQKKTALIEEVQIGMEKQRIHTNRRYIFIYSI